MGSGCTKSADHPFTPLPDEAGHPESKATQLYRDASGERGFSKSEETSDNRSVLNGRKRGVASDRPAHSAPESQRETDTGEAVPEVAAAGFLPDAAPVQSALAQHRWYAGAGMPPDVFEQSPCAIDVGPAQIHDAVALPFSVDASQQESKDYGLDNPLDDVDDWKLRRKQMITRTGLHDFHILALLHTGSVSKVAHVLHRRTRRHYAVKVVDKERCIERYGSDVARRMFRERSIMRMVSGHPFIVQLEFDIETPKHIMLFMELVNGCSLADILLKNKGLPQEQVVFHAAEIVLALAFLHSKNIVYRDLEPSNILLDERGHIKLVDFGSAERLTNQVRKRQSVRGNVQDKPPEMLAGRSYSFGVDWWFFAVLLFNMLAGAHPFQVSLLNELLAGDGDAKMQRSRTAWPKGVRQNARDLVDAMLVEKPVHRLGSGPSRQTFKLIQKQPFFAKVNWLKVERQLKQPPFIPLKNPAINVEENRIVTDDEVIAAYRDLQHLMEDWTDES